MSNTNSILLNGLDGSNPLAFLAALGTLRTLTLALPDESVKMVWEQADGAWRPRVWCSLAGDCDRLVSKLDEILQSAAGRISFEIGDNLNLSIVEFSKHLISSVRQFEATRKPSARVDADFLAAFGSEVVANDDNTMQDTALRTMSGAGHQHFLKFIREIVAKTDFDHLRRTLLAKWDYCDEGRGMNLRWDPLDDRRYALRWDDPSTDPSKTMRGANRLAIEAIPLLPTMPTAGRIATTLFRGSGARGTYLNWPIWSVPLSVEVVRSLLCNTNHLLAHTDDRIRIGVVAVFSSARITVGKFRNFTPSVTA